MTDAPTPRRRGRPEQGTGIDEAAILKAALVLLEQGQSLFSMRALARQLHVDVMALYHYFPSKDALLDAAILAAFSPLDELEAGLDAQQDMTARLETLAVRYLETVRRYPGLTVEIARGRLSAAGVVSRFDALFARVVRPLDLTDEQIRRAGHVLVDYLHGFMLGGESGEAWRFGVRVLALGLQHPSCSSLPLS